jgi:hypothetical protein
MKNKIFLAVFATLLIAGITYGQLQQSGGPGSTVTVTSITNPLPAGTNVIGHVINDASAAVIGHVITDSGSVASVSLSAALPTGSNVIGTVNSIPKTACGNTVASQALAAVPTSSTAVFSSTTCVMTIVLNNTNSSSVTVTVTDNQGTPINDVLTFSIPANSQLIQPLWGVAFTSGVKWVASTTGVTGAVLGYQ